MQQLPDATLVLCDFVDRDDFVVEYVRCLALLLP